MHTEQHTESASRAGGAEPAGWPRALVLALAVALCYANSLRVPFLFDDPQPGDRLHFATRPLVAASFALNRWLSAADTWSYHLFNALVHLCCGLLLFGVLRRALGHAAAGLGARTRANLAFVTALLWLCHPLQSAAVTYLSQRAEALGALFYLLVLYAFLRAAEAQRARAWQALALLALGLGFATKEIVATAPLTLLLLDALVLSPGPRAALRRRAGFYAGLGLVTLALAAVFILPLLGAEQISAGFRLAACGPLEYARTQPGVILHYLRLAVWPHPLVFDYGWPIARALGDWLPQSLALALLCAGSLVLLARRSWVGLAGAFFFLVLAPSSSFVPIKDLAFEHRMYLALAAPVLLAVVGAWWCLARFFPGPSWLRPAAALAAAAALTGATVLRNRDYRSSEVLWRRTVQAVPGHARAHVNLGSALIEAGRAREAVPELLEGLRLEPRDGLTYLLLGGAYVRLGEVERALPLLRQALERLDDPRCPDALGHALFLAGQVAESVPCFERALASRPADAGIHYRLACALAQLQRTQEASERYLEVLRLDPSYQDAHINLSALLTQQGRGDQALEHARAALAIEPNSVEELFGLARAFLTLGRHDEAMSTFREASRLAPELPEPYAAFAESACRKPGASASELEEALRLVRKANALTSSARPEFRALQAELEARLATSAATKPGSDAAGDDPRALDLRAQALFQQGDAAGAAEQFRQAVERAPDDAGLRHRFACALLQLQRGEDACAQELEAVRLAPELQDAHINLAAVLSDMGRADEALGHARKALAIQPNSAEEHCNLALALRTLGQLDEALQAFEEASRVAPELPEPLAAFAKTMCMKPDASPAQRREALRRARRANELVRARRADFLEICAQAHAALDEYEEAARLVGEALKLPGPSKNAAFAERLRAQRAEYSRKAGH